MAFPHPAREREFLLPEEKQICSPWMALRGYCLGAAVFVCGVVLAGVLVWQTKPPVPDPKVEYPLVKAAAVRAVLDAHTAPATRSAHATAICVYADRSAAVRQQLRDALPEYAGSALAEDCEREAHAQQKRPLWLHVGRVTWPNRSYAVVVFAMNGRGEIILHKTPAGYALHDFVWPIS